LSKLIVKPKSSCIKVRYCGYTGRCVACHFKKKPVFNLKNKVFEIEVPIKRYKQLIFVFGCAGVKLFAIILFAIFKMMIGKLPFKIEFVSTLVFFL